MDRTDVSTQYDVQRTHNMHGDINVVHLRGGICEDAAIKLKMHGRYKVHDGFLHRKQLQGIIKLYQPNPTLAIHSAVCHIAAWRVR